MAANAGDGKGRERKRKKRGGKPKGDVVEQAAAAAQGAGADTLLGDPKSGKIDKATEVRLRAQAKQEIEAQVQSDDLVVLVSDRVEWFERRDGRWRALASELFKARLSDLLDQWFVDSDDVKHGGAAYQWRREDPLEMEVHLRARSQPPGWEMLSDLDREKPFNLDTGELLHGAAFGQTMVTVDQDGELTEWDIEPRDFFRTNAGYEWAGATDEPPDEFGKWLAFVFPDDEDDRWALAVIIGAIIMGDLPKLQSMLMLIGEGGTGKGTTIRLIDKLLGDDAMYEVRSPALLGGQFSMSHVRGKRLLVVSDMPARPNRGQLQGDFDKGMGTIKNLAGGDRVDIEVKYGVKAESRLLNVAVIVASNYEPTWIVGAEDASAWERRLLPFKFLQFPEQEDAQFLDDVLIPELPEIAAYCVTQYADARRHIWETEQRPLAVRDLRPPGMKLRLAQIIAAARGEAGQFIDAKLAADPDSYVANKTLRAEYAQFLGIEPDKLQDGKIKALYAGIRTNFPHVIEKRRSGGAGFQGIALVDDGDEPFVDDDEYEQQQQQPEPEMNL